MIKIMNAFFKKFNVVCSICGNQEKYMPLSDFYRENAEKYGYVYFGQGEMTALHSYSCPKCGGSDRERLYAYWLQHQLIKSQNLKMIHFAPEPSLSMWIKNNFSIEYETADLMMDGVDYKIDMLDMPFEDNSYDCFICSHVLEHVADDGVAISELYRILKKCGWGILMAPVCTKIEHTLENKSHTSEEDRWRYYGQNDHVRLYSHNDYVNKISSSGFKVKQLNKKYFGNKVFRQLGLKDTSILYIVEKI